MKYLLVFLSFLLIHTANTQDLNDSIEVLYNKGEYLEIIKLFDNQVELNDISYYYVGYSYFMQSEYNKANEYYYKSLKINQGNPLVYYSMSISYQNLDMKDSALLCIDKAMNLDKTVTEYVTYKGDLFHYHGDRDSALFYFVKSTEMKLSGASEWINLADVYAEFKLWEKAERTYKKALEICDSGSETYLRCLYNMGLTLYLMGKFEEAEKSFREIIEILPEDYTTITKLIQCYYGQKDYKKGDALKKELYKVRKEGNLPPHLEKMFCFDQFTWNNQKIMVFEKFDEPEDFLYYKHIFYVLLEDENEYDCTIQSEHSSAVSSIKKKYVMGMNKGNTHSTYWQFLFEEKFSYEKMKKAAIEILEGKVSPSSSSSY